jgi:hypothetical protein
VYFYELHEGDDELYSDVLLAREEEIPAEEFFDLVQAIRRRIQDSHHEDTLIEAIAADLQREHGFVYISDERLTAAVNVSPEDEENFLIATEDEFSAMGLDNADYRAVFTDYVDEDGGQGKANRPN